MSPQQRSRHATFRRAMLRRGMSLVEVSISMLILVLCTGAALNTVAATIGTQVVTEDQNRGLFLAQDLMEEILQKAYAEPFEEEAFGPESSERGGTRAAFDDVDDYDNWSSSPPETDTGDAWTDLDAWRRSVTVRWVAPANSAFSIDTESGAKTVTVTVLKNERTIMTLTMLVTRSWLRPPYE